MHLNMAFTFSLQKKRVSKHLIINVLKLFKIINPLTLPYWNRILNQCHSLSNQVSKVTHHSSISY